MFRFFTKTSPFEKTGSNNASEMLKRERNVNEREIKRMSRLANTRGHFLYERNNLKKKLSLRIQDRNIQKTQGARGMIYLFRLLNRFAPFSSSSCFETIVAALDSI